MGVPNAHWAESKLNQEYGLCSTYPKVLYFPKSCSDDVIIGSSKFRSRGRLPTLTYYYEPKNVSLFNVCTCLKWLVLGYVSLCFVTGLDKFVPV